MTEDLHQTIEELRAAVQARDDFIAIAAHELRNPMTPIASQVDLLLAAVGRGDSHAVVLARLERLKFFIRHYIRRATTLLNISRATSGEIRLEPRPVDLSELVRSTVQGYALMAERARCALLVDVPEGVVGIWDRLAVEQVLDNLLSNALKFGAGQAIDVALTVGDARVSLTVRDRGAGISAEDQARIFGRFEQALGQRQHGGFGIGLWLVHRLVSAMGGGITVESEPGRGAMFIVTLPWRMPTPSAEEEQA
ncbi:MAG TPA: HAMP domain-containing sensor histidine kinase [Acetobacteraceae bacterium]|nr:HAMP domain-containing sensor histidine kinase [Acetobacteraceae bacterium]